LLAQAEQRFVEASLHLTRAAEAARRLGFFATEGFHLATLGRVLQQVGDNVAAINTLEQAIEIGQTAGEMRVTSLARARLGRVLRETGDRERARSTLEAADSWYRTAGGGDGAALAAYLLAAMDAEDGVADATQRLTALRDQAHNTGDAEIELLTLDALAHSHAQTRHAVEAVQLLETADQLMPSVQHCVSETDRFDARATRALIETAEAQSPS
jgi:tetratricopeptide (TPR) repeat protein